MMLIYIYDAVTCMSQHVSRMYVADTLIHMYAYIIPYTYAYMRAYTSSPIYHSRRTIPLPLILF